MIKLRLAASCLTLISTFALCSSLALARTDSEIEKVDYKKLLKEVTPLEGTTPAQWRVTWTGDTTSSATVSWTTAVAGRKHVLHIGTQPQGDKVEKYKRHLTHIKSGPYSISAKEAATTKTAFFHHCELTQLSPNTRYYFVIESDGKFSRPLYFKTSSKTGDFKLLCGGDSRSGHVSRCRMNLRMAKLFEQNPDILALNHGGDYVASGHSWRQWRLWLSHNELTTLSDGRVLPIIPTRGNHDGGPLFFEVFNLKKPSGKLHFWHSIYLPSRVGLVTLDTNFSAKGAQEKWLKEQLSVLRPKTNWLLTNYHRPLYPAVKSPAGQTSVFVPLFEKYNVDLACESDGHCIKRTVPIRNGKEDQTGVVYIGEGGLGVGQYRPKPDRWYLQKGYVSRGHHVMLLEFSKDTLQIQTVLLSGKIVDQHVLKRRATR